MIKVVGYVGDKSPSPLTAQVASRQYPAVRSFTYSFIFADFATVRSELKINAKLNASATSLPDAVKPTATSSSDLVAQVGTRFTCEIAAWLTPHQVNGYLASDVVPNARKFLVEADKTLALCSSIVTTAVAPSLKSRSKLVMSPNAPLSSLISADRWT